MFSMQVSCDKVEEVWVSIRFYKASLCRGARGVMVIVIGNGHGDTSSNPGRD